MSKDTFMALLTTILQDCRARLCGLEGRVLHMLGERIRRKSAQIEATYPSDRRAQRTGTRS
jgi:hypothetical protein